MTEVKTLTIDGVEHELDKFSDTVKNLVQIHSKWAEDRIKEQLALTKTDAAIAALNKELSELVAKELAPAPEEATDVEVK